MLAADLEYENLVKHLKPFTDKGRPTSIAFLNWFLEHIYRLDQINAEDVICDKSNDRGIDGLYVEHDQLEIHVFQSKTKQKGTIGDKDIREFSGTLNQLRTTEALDTFLKGKVDAEVKEKITKSGMPGLLEKGYRVRGVYVTNSDIDANGRDVINSDADIIPFDRSKIAESFVDLKTEGGVAGNFELISDGAPLVHQAGTIAKVVIFLAEGQHLATMPGIADGTLFALNVRLPLGSTKVNRAIRETLHDQPQHQKFALFHNGVTILAEEITIDGERISIRNFVVVNGAQSLKQFHSELGSITHDLKVLTRIIEIGADTDLAREISINSNNQNGIKARDLRSNDILQTRLKAEFDDLAFEDYIFDVKRGESSSGNTISNEYAGKLLLAFDLDEPWSCHQTYKVMDEKYSDIFGRPGVTAKRIIFLHKIMNSILAKRAEIKNGPFGHYGLTSYFLLAAVKRLLDQEPRGQDLCRNPESIFEADRIECVMGVIDDLLTSIIIDINHEIDSGEMADYKSDLKSRTSIEKMLSELVRSYEKDKARGKIDDLESKLANCFE